MVEAAQSYGSSRLQMLIKVKLPQALPSIMLGVNQTIMMALGLAVLAVFIGGGGLGEQVWKALTRLKVGWAFEAGICIVFMAIIFDRLSYAVSGVTKIENAHVARDKKFHLLPHSLIVQLIARPFEAFAPAFAKKIIARPFLIIGMLLLLAAYFFGGDIKWMNTFPRDLEISFRDPIDHAINWLTEIHSHSDLSIFSGSTGYLSQ